MRPTARSVASLLLLAPALARGQGTSRLTADVGVASLAQPTLGTTTAPTLGASWRGGGGALVADLSAAATLASADRWAAQGGLAAAWALGRDGTWELGGAASALRYRGAGAATHGVATMRRRVDRMAWSGWVGAGGGWLARPGTAAPVLAADAGLWRRVGPLALSAALSAQRARLDSVPRFGAPPAAFLAASAGRRDVAVGVAELTGAAEWRGGAGELVASAGLRRAPQQFAGARAVLLVSGTWWAASQLGVVVSAGDQPAEPLRGMPPVRHVSAALRWRPRPAGGGAAVRPPAPAPADALDAELTRGPAGATLALRAPAATRVEVRGDWTAWQPVALERRGDRWVLPAPVPAGTHRLTVRVDGGAWRVPANLAAADDDFGSRVALLVVP